MSAPTKCPNCQRDWRIEFDHDDKDYENNHIEWWICHVCHELFTYVVPKKGTKLDDE